VDPLAGLRSRKSRLSICRPGIWRSGGERRWKRVCGPLGPCNWSRRLFRARGVGASRNSCDARLPSASRPPLAWAVGGRRGAQRARPLKATGAGTREMERGRRSERLSLVGMRDRLCSASISDNATRCASSPRGSTRHSEHNTRRAPCQAGGERPCHGWPCGAMVE
jgi:hypothetical protein